MSADVGTTRDGRLAIDFGGRHVYVVSRAEALCLASDIAAAIVRQEAERNSFATREFIHTVKSALNGSTLKEVSRDT